MKLLLVYHSRYGSTQQYAEWLQAQVGGELISVKDVAQHDLAEFDMLVFGSWVEKDPDVKRGMVTDFDGVRQEALQPLVTHTQFLLAARETV